VLTLPEDFVYTGWAALDAVATRAGGGFAARRTHSAAEMNRRSRVGVV